MTQVDPINTATAASETSELLKFICTTPDDTRRAAVYAAHLVSEQRRCFALYGDVGIGKTTFTKYFIQSLNPAITDITSPTFTLVQIYPMMNGLPDLWHVDCYRLKSPSEFDELGLDDAFRHNIVIVEWPNIIEHLLPPNTIKICMTVNPDDSRNIKIFAAR
jgi:tRNA threonylcarbamoyladenosine biosynthesis protein TsaE